MEQSVPAVAPHDIYRPRAVEHVGVWHIGDTSFKVYGILADGKTLTSEIMQEADLFVRHDLPGPIMREGCDNGLRFLIVHPGDLGVSMVAHWWVQGSVLCQRIRRRLYGADGPMETATRPVVACVWELGLINLEQQLWRGTMMIDPPDPSAYLNTRAAATHV